LLLYLVSVGVLHRFEKRQVVAFTSEAPDAFPGLTVRQVAIRYLLAAVVVVASGIWLPYATLKIAEQMGWHAGFAGTMLTAFATSLPEFVVTMAALRLGAIDMAVGNLLGSNLFNMVVLAIDDLVYPAGPLLADVSPAHLVSTLFALMMSGTALVALYYRSRLRWWARGDWPSLLLLILYALNGLLVYVVTSSH
jgi:cation:H+ antiporter